MMKRIILALALMLAPSCAWAATELSVASGNIGTAATWDLVEPGTFSNSNTSQAIACGNNTFAPATPTSSLTSTGSTLNGIGTKIASISGGTGTITLRIYDVTSSAAVAGSTTAAINISSLPQTPLPTAAQDDGGWVFGLFSSGTTVTLTNGHDYAIQCEASSGASTVDLEGSSATTPSQVFFTSTNQAPAAGDNFFVSAEYSSTGTLGSVNVTINTTSGTTYGSESSFGTLANPAISVGQGGTFCIGAAGTCGPAASTAYVFQFAGQEVTYNGGTVDFGTSGSPVPSTGSATITEEVTTEGNTGFNTRNGGTFNVAGSSGGRSVVKTKLAVTATGGVTSTLTTADSTGWLSGDSIYVAGTNITSASVASYLGDAATLSGNASGASVTLSSALTNTHTATQLSYTSTSTGIAYSFNMYADVVLLNRNVVIQGSGASTNGYLYFQANSNFAATWVEFNEISGVNAGQRGIEADTGPAGTFSLTDFSIINSHNSTLILAPTNKNFGGPSSSAYVLVQHGTLYNDGTASQSAGTNQLAVLSATVNPYWKIDDIACILCGNGGPNGNSRAISLFSVVGQFSNISMTGSGMGANSIPVFLITTAYGAASQIGGGVGNTFGPLTFYSNVGFTISGSNGGGGLGATGTVSGIYIWHEQGRAEFAAMGSSLVIDPFYMIDSGFGIYVPPFGADITFRNGVIGFDGGTVTPILTLDANAGTFRFDNMDICPTGSVGGITFLSCSAPPFSLLNDLSVGAGDYNAVHAEVYLRNSSVLSGSAYPTLNGQESYYSPYSFVLQDCASCSPIKHGVWLQGGFDSYDTTITHTSGYSERLTPRVTTFSGYIAGATLTLTSSNPTVQLGPSLTSNGVGFVPGTTISSGTSPYVVTQSQTVGSSGSPAQFQDYIQYGSLVRLTSAPRGFGIKVAVKSGVSNAQFCEYLRPSVNTDAAPPWGGSAVTYNGDAPRMIVRQNPYMGVQSDTVIATSSPTAGTWGQFCGTLPTAPADGEFEVVIDADQTFTSNAGGWINIAEPSCSNCNLTNTSQFWFNGVPFDASVPASGGGGGSFPPSIVNWLLKRDLDPSSNDDSPLWLKKVG